MKKTDWPVCELCPLIWVDGNCIESDSSECNLILDCCFNYLEWVKDIEYYSNKYGKKKAYRKSETLKRRVVKLAYRISQLPERKEQSNED